VELFTVDLPERHFGRGPIHPYSKLDRTIGDSNRKPLTRPLREPLNFLLGFTSFTDLTFPAKLLVACRPMPEDNTAPIIIVDDSDGDAMLLERVLRQCKLLNPIICFKKSQDCLDYISKSINETPVLILVDLIMPPPDGIEVIESLSRSGVTARAPTVMLSGLTDIKLIQRGYQNGAKTFLVKPVSLEDLMQLFSTLKQIRIEQTPDGYVLSLGNRAREEEATAFFKRGGFAFST
jgi:CheY-like chemotaxis protein